MLRPLPIGIQTFRDLINGGFLYVDKTRWVYELIRYAKGAYFLARPRRFGKSLLISTLDEIFQGNRELFSGLWLYDSDYSWAKHPVIHLDFSLLTARSAQELEEVLSRRIHAIGRERGVAISPGNVTEQFASLIQGMASDAQVVVLIDEYDKPILDNISDLSTAQEIRDLLKRFYTVLKAMDPYLRLIFLTGISKFSKVGVFSGLNNLNDISMNPRFAAALGVTEDEISRFLAEHMERFAQDQAIAPAELTAQIRHWYNGFLFAPGGENVYNPFSLMLLFDQHRFSNFWFESGRPTFLIDLIRDRGYDVRQLGNLELEELSFSTYELENLAVEPLLFQTGYLTIKDYDPQSRLYRLGYPNFEVENAFSQHLLHSHSGVALSLTGSHLWKLIRALQANDLVEFFAVLDVFFADIPYDIQIRQERYYQTIFYLVFRLIGLRVDAEVRTSRGRIDAVIALEKAVYLFEFKLDGDPEEALAQIAEREYYRRYAGQARPLVLVGVNFSTEQRRVESWRTG